VTLLDPQCQGCGRVFLPSTLIGRSEICPNCGADLHSCVQCEFYDPAVSNQCREPQAERVGDKERANFCEFFRLSRKQASAAPQPDDPLAKLEALFRK
jgi:predicted  nucleic acid-binding Zn-ribbon protein